MKASETRLQSIIEGSKQYTVPLFQRSYSWGEKEWKVLWSDLVELCEQENPRTHFIGSVVTMPTTSTPEGIVKFLLIDGQQRLTTIFILLALLCDKARSSDEEELADEIKDTLLVNRYKKDVDYYKLLPTQVDRTAFFNIIRSQEPVDGAAMTLAYQFFERKFRQSGLSAKSLKKVISTNLSVVSIVLDYDDDPYLVFESLNAKGRPLTQSDLIRNYFFMKIPAHQQEDVYAQYWSPMQEALGESLTEFIRHYLMKDGKQVKQSDIYYLLKDRINESDALESLKDLACFASYYRKLLQPQAETNSNIQRALLRLQRIEVTTAYPFLLNCYHDYQQGQLSAQEFTAILQVLENFMLRRFVCNIATNQLNKIFPLLYFQAKDRNEENLVEGVKASLLTKNYPKDAEFKARLVDGKLYGAGDRLVKTRLILESLEEAFHHKEQVDFSRLSIEHVMPQTLTDEWKDMLGGDWEMTHELLLHTLGNLTLTAYNSELSNDPFPVKRKHLSESHLELNKYFVDKASWKREDIEARSAYLADLALKIWPYLGGEKSEPREPGTVTSTTPVSLSLLGQRFTVRSWRDVLERTLNTIADLEPEKFDLLVQQFHRLISRDKTRFRAARQLKNGYFIEVNLSAHNIHRFCFQILEIADLSAEDWHVETTQV